MKTLTSPITIIDAINAFDTREVTASEILNECLAGCSEDDSVYTALFTETARAEAEAADHLRAAGVPAGPLAGVPISIKSLFAVAGHCTHAGSRVLAQQPPSHTDAAAVTLLRRAGAVLTGHTNMTEFAYSGLGLNPHYGTPTNPHDSKRIPGGSSSGAAVSVARGQALAAIGTDTGGSLRIPAAFCGLVGFKPSSQRVSLDGALPLSRTLDSVGPIAHSVADCARLDTVLIGEPDDIEFAPDKVAGLRLGIPDRYMLRDMDETVSRAFTRSIDALKWAGAYVTIVELPELDALGELLAGGGFTAAESYYLYQSWLVERSCDFDPRVKDRIQRGAEMTAADYIALQVARRRQIAQMDRRLATVDALISPTVPMIAPRFDDLTQDAAYTRENLRVLRNPSVGNLLDLCGISLPCHQPGELPVGLMMLTRNGGDRRLLRQAAGVEALLGSLRL